VDVGPAENRERVRLVVRAEDTFLPLDMRVRLK